MAVGGVGFKSHVYSLQSKFTILESGTLKHAFSSKEVAG